MSELRFVDLLQTGELGDTPLGLHLTAREVGAVQLVLTIAIRAGLLQEVANEAAAVGVLDRWAVSFQAAQARIGIALARAFDGDVAELAEFSAVLARIDQDQTALDNGEEL